ncbi:MAG TPA: dihydrodipicolinate synthase family protein [Longimicrobiales bacterium]|nr:dihydrodipicolinate synthase family protein [Longimicrobiales bacterium]
MHERLRGLFIPLATPFDARTGDIAVLDFRSNIRKWLDTPINGYVLFGSNGEGVLLSDDEKTKLTAFAREIIPPSYPLVVGISAESTRAVVAECKRLADQGAEYALVSPPAYFGSKLGAGAIADHYKHAADESPIPLIVYHIPQNTHVVIDPPLMAEIVRHKNIVGLKDSSGDVKRFAEYSNTCDKACRLFIGNGSLLYTALELGAVGGIVGIGQFAPEPTAELIEAFVAGDKVKAGKIQERLVPVHKEIVGAHGAVGTKAALDLTGYVGGKPRPPLRPLSEKEQRRVAQVLHEAGLAYASTNVPNS